MRPPFRSYPSRLSPQCSGRQRIVKYQYLVIALNLTLGYYVSMKKKPEDASSAASLMGRRSAEARKKKWGKKEFKRRMREWGKLGGRPKGSGKKEK